MRGIVSSNKMIGVVGVTVAMVKIHPLYNKRLNRSKKFLASCDTKLNIGDEVEIKETRPQSRRVRFAVTKVVTRVELLPEVREAATSKDKPTKAAAKSVETTKEDKP